VRSVHIFGAGELGATLAYQLARREACRRIALIDADVGKAKGKALDIAQSGPVEHFDASLEGFATLEAAGAADAWVLADPPELLGPGAEKRIADVARAVAGIAGTSPVVVANAAHAADLVEALASRLPERARAIGSAPVAFASALRRRLADELGIEPSAITVAALGSPPAHAVVPFGSVLVGGVPVDRLSPVATRRALEALRPRALGPVALAHAAARVLRALRSPRPVVLPVFAMLTGEYGHRGLALAVPARICNGRVEAVLESTLDPVDRVALDGAADRRRPSQG
jgi:malate dehydrogenase